MKKRLKNSVKEEKNEPELIFSVEEDGIGQRIDSYLSGYDMVNGPVKGDLEALEEVNWTRSYVKRLLKKGAIKINDEYAEKPAFKLNKGDTISVILVVDDYMEEVIPEEMDLNIIYEDENIIFLNKRTGLVVHPGAGNPQGTLANGILWYLEQKGISKFDEGEISRKVGLVHRLDKETSGGILIAKKASVMSKLMKEFQERRVNKYYVAVCYNENLPVEEKPNLKEDSLKEISINDLGEYIENLIKKAKTKMSILSTNVSRNRSDRRKMTVSDTGRFAETEWKILGRVYLRDKKAINKTLYLVLLKPKTGRLHQLRVHTKELGIPILGDPVYGKGYGKLGFMFLHSFYLGFPNVEIRKLLERNEFIAEVTANWTDAIEKVEVV